MGKKSTTGDKHQRAAQRAINGIKAFGQPSHGNQGDGKIRSLGTARQYQQIYKQVSKFLAQEQTNLRSISIEQAERYLDERRHQIQDKQLANERQALKIHLWNVKQDKSIDLQRFKSTREAPSNEPRAYSQDQVKEIIKNCPTQREKVAVAISYSAGLRAHELLRIARVDERPVVHRAAEFSKERFAGGREAWPTYTVKGKGGGEREIKIPPRLAQRLEETRLPEPRYIKDRGVSYEQRYDLPGGQDFSDKFTEVATKAIGFSNGHHGLRHTFAQERLRELKADGRCDDTARRIVTQELGHWSTTNLAYYLR